MVTKRKSARRAAPRRRTYAARRAAPRRRRTNSGIPKIPAAAATVALVAVNMPKIKTLYKAISNNGKDTKIMKMIQRTEAGISGENSWINNSMKDFISAGALVTDALAVAGGYVGGEIVKKYAPGVIKRPLGKIAKKIPKVI